MRKYDLNSTTLVFLGLLLAFFGLFLFYPIIHLLKGAFVSENRFTLQYFQMLLLSPLQRQALLNSFLIAVFTTAFATLLTLPLAHLLTRFQFRGKAILSSLLLVPMIM